MWPANLLTDFSITISSSEHQTELKQSHSGRVSESASSNTTRPGVAMIEFSSTGVQRSVERRRSFNWKRIRSWIVHTTDDLGIACKARHCAEAINKCFRHELTRVVARAGLAHSSPGDARPRDHHHGQPYVWCELREGHRNEQLCPRATGARHWKVAIVTAAIGPIVVCKCCALQTWGEVRQRFLMDR